MKTVLHEAGTRGHADHGWLNTHHTFSFANYYNPERIHFGALRVLNDDIVKPSMGFARHPHDNMEIISIPLRGALEHQDSMGNTFVIEAGDVQVMTAGTGVHHSEKNHSTREDVNFLQIWVFPKQRDIAPRYGQATFLPENRLNRWQVVVAPDAAQGIWINQDAWFSMARLEAGKTLGYDIARPENGAYLFVLEGSIEAAGHALKQRDGLGISETSHFELRAVTDSEVLLMDVPMRVH